MIYRDHLNRYHFKSNWVSCSDVGEPLTKQKGFIRQQHNSDFRLPFQGVEINESSLRTGDFHKKSYFG